MYHIFCSPKMSKEKLGSMWFECAEPFTLAARAFGDADIELQRELYRALETNEKVCANTHRRSDSSRTNEVLAYF